MTLTSLGLSRFIYKMGIHIGVTLEDRVNTAEGGQILKGEEALACQGGIQSGGGVTLGEDETVAFIPLGIFGIHLHFGKIQIRHNIGDGERAAGVTRGGGVNAIQDSQTDHSGFLFQLCQLCSVHSMPLSAVA